MSEAPEIKYQLLVERDDDVFTQIMRTADGRVWRSWSRKSEAYDEAYRAAFAERERLGWPPGDPRIQFPERPEAS